MQMDRDPGSGARGSAAAKTKGKRSKLSQRRRDDDAGGGGLPSLRVAGDGGHANVDDPSGNPGAPIPGSLFSTGDPLGLDVGDAMQQGSPTLLSALKGSSLRAAYGQDFAGAFKEDNMNLLGDFKNAAARFSMHPLGSADGLSAEGDLQSDALWSSFPSDVCLFPDAASKRRYRPYARNTERNAASNRDAEVIASAPSCAVSAADVSLFVTSRRAAASRFFRNAACFARMSRSLESFRNSAESSVEEMRPATLALFAYRGFEDQCRSSGCLPDRCSLASMAFASVRSRYARNARSASRAGISSTMSSAEKSAMVVVARAIAS
mgnify:CR=1 FL=1